jgi:hypothetical protein
VAGSFTLLPATPLAADWSDALAAFLSAVGLPMDGVAAVAFSVLADAGGFTAGLTAAFLVAGLADVAFSTLAANGGLADVAFSALAADGGLADVAFSALAADGGLADVAISALAANGGLADVAFPALAADGDLADVAFSALAADGGLAAVDAAGASLADGLAAVACCAFPASAFAGGLGLPIETDLAAFASFTAYGPSGIAFRGDHAVICNKTRPLRTHDASCGTRA